MLRPPHPSCPTAFHASVPSTLPRTNISWARLTTRPRGLPVPRPRGGFPSGSGVNSRVLIGPLRVPPSLEKLEGRVSIPIAGGGGRRQRGSFLILRKPVMLEWVTPGEAGVDRAGSGQRVGGMVTTESSLGLPCSLPRSAEAVSPKGSRGAPSTSAAEEGNNRPRDRTRSEAHGVGNPGTGKSCHPRLRDDRSDARQSSRTRDYDSSVCVSQ